MKMNQIIMLDLKLIRASLLNSCPFQVTITCNSTAKYRSHDGTCNNLQNPLLGSINTLYTRILSPTYGDGTNWPRNLSLVTGKALPNPRTISLSLSVPTSDQKLVKNGLTKSIVDQIVQLVAFHNKHVLNKQDHQLHFLHLIVQHRIENN
jgi:hypothetical protein